MSMVISKKFVMPEKITLESLALMVASGFQEVHEKFERLEITLEQMKMRLDNMAPLFELKELEKRVDKIEKKIGL